MTEEVKKQSNKGFKEEIQELKKENRILKDELSGIMKLFNGVGDGIVYISKHRRVVRANTALLKIGGYEKEDIVGKKLTTLALEGVISPKSLTKTIKAFIGRMKGEDLSPYDVVLTTKDGTKIDVEVHGTLVKDEKGNAMGTVAVLRDIGFRKEMKDVLKDKNENLEKLNNVMIGRELKMIELKEKIERLEKKLEESN